MNHRRLALLLLLVAGGVPHHHADHDGGTPHVEAAHGSHGPATAAHDPRLPAVGAPLLVATLVAFPELNPHPDDAPRPVYPDTTGRPHGRDPPPALGPRAPPHLSA